MSRFKYQMGRVKNSMAKMDPLSRRTLTLMVVIGPILVLASLFFGAWKITVGVLAGWGVAVADFWLIQRFVNNLLEGHQRGFFSSGYLIRFAAICGALYVLVRSLELDVVAIAVGFSALVVATILSGLKGVDGTSLDESASAGEGTNLEISDG